MIRNPTFHYDFLMQSPGAPEFQAMVARHFEGFTNEDLMAGTIPQFLNELDGTTRMSSYMLQLYRRFGQHTYVLGPRVQELFRRTQLKKITPEMIVPPVSAFYVAVADCPWQLWGGDRTKMHNLAGIYISFNKVYQGGAPPGGVVAGALPPGAEVHDCINIMLWGAANERSINKFDDTILWFSISLDRWMKAGHDLETFFQNHSVMTADADSLEGADWNPRLDVLPRILLGEPDPFRPQFVPETPEGLTSQRETLVNVLRLVLNLCLYMRSEEPDLDVQDWKDKATVLKKKIETKKSPGKRKKLERQLTSLPRTRVVYVGPMFEELPGTGDVLVRDSQGGTHVAPVEHGVAPHWQRYHVGSGDSRTTKWRLKGMYRRGGGTPDRIITKFRE